MNTAQLEVGVMEVLAEHPYCTTDQLADRLQVSSTLLAVVLRELEGLTVNRTQPWRVRLTVSRKMKWKSLLRIPVAGVLWPTSTPIWRGFSMTKVAFLESLIVTVVLNLPTVIALILWSQCQ